jgi:excisionase family DNA binding protein
MQQENPVLSIKETATALRISPRQVARLIAAGELLSFSIGSRRLIRAETLRAFVARLETQSRQAA